MNTTVTFTFLSAVLSKYSAIGLPPEAAQACNVSPESYARLFQSLTAEQQQVFQTHFTFAEKHIIQLNALGQANEESPLHTLVVRHLLAIGSFLKQTTESDLIADEELLKQVKPEHKQKASEQLRVLFSCCRTPEHKRTLELFCKNIPANLLPEYLENLRAILPRVGSTFWPIIAVTLRTDRINEISVLAKLVRACAVLSPDQIMALAQLVSEFQKTPEALEAAIPILSLCATHSRIPDIVLIIAKTRVEDRLEFVEKVRDLLKTATSGKRVYEVLAHEAYPFLKYVDFAEKMSIDTRVLVQEEREAPAEFTLFIVNEAELSSKPARTLSSFLEVVNKTKYISIVFPDKVLARGEAMSTFITLLSQSLCKKCCKGTVLPNGLVCPEQASLSPEEEITLFNVGKLFMYCRTDIVFKHEIGKVLDMSVFIALKRLVPSLLKREISQETFELFYPIYKEMRGLKEDVALSEEAKESLLESMKKALIPCMAIRRAMVVPKTTTAEDLEASIQGQVTREQIFANINFGSEITTDSKSSIKSWIFKLAKNPSKLKQFLVAVTQSPILTPKSIHITMQGKKLNVCPNTQTVFLPERTSIDDALKELELALESDVLQRNNP